MLVFEDKNRRCLYVIRNNDDNTFYCYMFTEESCWNKDLLDNYIFCVTDNLEEIKKVVDKLKRKGYNNIEIIKLSETITYTQEDL